MYWEKKTFQAIKDHLLTALAENENYRRHPVLGLPASYLDADVFYNDAPFLKDRPFIRALVDNPNHIGCHTVSRSESAFAGTQAIERELIKLCAEQIFGGNPDEQDGYVASGGSESNIQALWIYRNYFMREHHAQLNEIGVFYSADTHYSIPKAGNLLLLQSFILPVEKWTREISQADLENTIQQARNQGVKYFIVVMNMATTMFGSVDDVNRVGKYLQSQNLNFKIHIDAAFGGFVYPFTNPDNVFSFQNPYITSFTLDAHKMLQAPYGTGIFLIRKGYMFYGSTKEAQYVQGGDYTVCGSRSGANVVAVWMILYTHGYEGWHYKMMQLLDRTSRLCAQLDEMEVKYYRNPFMNLVTIHSEFIPQKLAEKYYLVPDTHDRAPEWYKIVMMSHVSQGLVDSFVNDLEVFRSVGI
ncbi:MAG: pyridoxal-dependent decarboxylase [Microscillaceae bacterium]|jgi:glutamate/tyrosine decarboxylase-like PLP-dependent enzyme|nr:pyridoxal-dependent decarboxylase [Microscillaceae bacterium]